MRDFKGMKRNRNRNRGGGGGGGGGGAKPQHNANRAFDSNGPEGIKVRGAAQHVYEKYQQLARDAQTGGDRVLAENYLQHAEHYFRLLRAMQPQRPVSDIIGRDQFVSGYDIDFEEEYAPEAQDAEQTESPNASEQADGGERPYRADNRYEGERRRDDRYQNDRPQNDRAQNDRAQNDRSQNDRAYGERRDGDRYVQRTDQRRDDRADGAVRRDDRFDNTTRRDDRGQRPWRDDRASPAGDRPRYNVEPRTQARDSVEFTGEDAPPVGVAVSQPETPVAETERLLRADDGEVSAAPAFLQPRSSEAGEETRRPRRRRAPRTFEPADNTGPTDDGV